jgi:hypothetical protein
MYGHVFKVLLDYSTEASITSLCSSNTQCYGVSQKGSVSYFYSSIRPTTLSANGAVSWLKCSQSSPQAILTPSTVPPPNSPPPPAVHLAVTTLPPSTLPPPTSPPPTVPPPSVPPPTLPKTLSPPAPPPPTLTPPALPPTMTHPTMPPTTPAIEIILQTPGNEIFWFVFSCNSC